MKKFSLTLALLLASIFIVFAQKSKYEFRDLVFQVFEQIDNEKSNLEVIASLKRKFTIVEEDSCVLVKGLPVGFDTRIYFFKTKVVFEQKNVETTTDLGRISSAITSLVDVLNRFGYIVTANYEYKNYSLKRNNYWDMYTDFNPYQGITWLVIKGDIKIQKTKEQMAREEEQKRLEENERKRKEEKERREREELLKREKEMGKLLSSINGSVLRYKVDSISCEKACKKVRSLDLIESVKPLIEELPTEVKVLIHVDSLGMTIVKIDDDVVDHNLNVLFGPASNYCVVNGNVCYKHGSNIFFLMEMKVPVRYLETWVCGLKNRNGNFVYYREAPDKVQEWCRENILTNGFHAIEYVICGDKCIINKIVVDKKSEQFIKGKDPHKAKKVWKSIGGAILLGGLVGVSAF